MAKSYKQVAVDYATAVIQGKKRKVGKEVMMACVRFMADLKREDLELVAVVLGCETSQERFAACKSLLDYGFANFCIVTPTAQEQSVPVKLGTVDSVVAVPANTDGVLLDKSQQSLASCRVELEESVSAPVAQGQRLGTLYLQAGEQVIAQIPMLAKEAVPKLTWSQIFLRLIKQLAMKG